jgi:hypothetical protein
LEDRYVVDDIRDTSGVVATGNGEFLYAWWVHSHPADSGGGRSVDSYHSRTQSGLVLVIGDPMKPLPMIGVLLLVLGLLSFVVPVPQRENHGVKIGDTKIGVQTETSEKLPPAIGVVLLAGGVVALLIGSRKS